MKMLTAYQCEVVAFATEYGELVCYDCAHAALDEGEDTSSLTPLIRYSLDEEQTARAEDGFCALAEDGWSDSECGCEPALQCERCDRDLVDEYVDTYWHEQHGEEAD